METGDRLPDTIENFADDQDIRSALVTYVGGAGHGSRMVVGPDSDMSRGIVPLVHTLDGHQEVLAHGTLFRNESDRPVLHMHAAVGREGGATVGCTRAGMEAWLVGEVLIFELVGDGARRRKDPGSGFELLELDGGQ
jgi:predicted DNA-binding protein with PD1-like motif